ncbi:hypothetical protein F2Q70_00022859 [Brassica cretica]|uniref:RNase H type-1 domain-containing protein n=2 Tax=Brassica cretica TaxID=69181 RepID=A0A3N6R9U1_BRACR|nr:hypothetical protein F2Q70_00022859 [Brassica cretica]KAF3589671.1 hypothetical protein F2Q69_00030963 [Brassica cretica]KAF3608328.1 hypothetical protein DY000_02049737 [Brassica cretica]
MEGLLWAVSCMRDRRITLVWFETDCSDLVDKTTNPMDWPSIATENRGVPEVTKGLPRCELVSYSSESEWPGRRISKGCKDHKLYFFSYRSDSDRWRCSSENRLVCSSLDLA